MPAQLSVTLQADPAAYEAAMTRAREATEDWAGRGELSAEQMAEALEGVIRSHVELGTMAGKTAEEIAAGLESVGISAENAKTAVETVSAEINKTADAAKPSTTKIKDSFETALDAAADKSKSMSKSLVKDFLESDRAATKSADEIENVLVKSYGVAEDAAKDLARGAKEGFKQIESGADDAGAKVAKIGDGTKDVEGAVTDLGTLAKSILTGDFEAASEGALGALGKLGVGAGIAGATGSAVMGAVTGLVDHIVGLWQGWHDALDDAKSAAFDFSSSLTEGIKWEDYQAGIDSWTKDTDRLKQAQDLATVAGWDLKDAIAALATGDGLEKLNADFQNVDIMSVPIEITGQRMLELDGILRGTADGFSEGADALALNAQLMYEYANAAGKATGETDDLGNAIVMMPDGKRIVIDADTKLAYADVDALEKLRLTEKELKIKTGPVDDSSVKTYRPSTVYIPGKIVLPGTRQAV